MSTVLNTTTQILENTTEISENTTQHNTLEQLLLAELTELNGLETEEELNMAIVKELLKEKLDESILNTSLEELESEVDNGVILNDGAYVFENEELYSWSFDKYDTMADAVRAAVLKINAKIIYKGKIVNYDALSDTDAYYIDNETNKVMIVNL